MAAATGKARSRWLEFNVPFQHKYGISETIQLTKLAIMFAFVSSASRSCVNSPWKSSTDRQSDTSEDAGAGSVMSAAKDGGCHGVSESASATDAEEMSSGHSWVTRSRMHKRAACRVLVPRAAHVARTDDELIPFLRRIRIQLRFFCRMALYTVCRKTGFMTLHFYGRLRFIAGAYIIFL